MEVIFVRRKQHQQHKLKTFTIYQIMLKSL